MSNTTTDGTRNFLITAAQGEKLLLNIPGHAVQQDRVNRAMENGTVPDNEPVTQFNFDLVETVKAIQTQRLSNDVLSRLAYSTDGYISGALSRMLNDFYQHSKLEEAPLSFDSYQQFLNHIEGNAASESLLDEMGLDTLPARERLSKLVHLRVVLHGILASKLLDPTQYETPSVEVMLSNPKLRSLSAQGEQGLREISEDDTDDEELRKEYFQQLLASDKSERENQLKMDRMKASSLVALWRATKMDAIDESFIDDETDPFFELDARTQLGLLTTTHRAIEDCRRRAVVDSRVPTLEKATLRVEAKHLLANINTQMKHKRFVEQ